MRSKEELNLAFLKYARDNKGSIIDKKIKILKLFDGILYDAFSRGEDEVMIHYEIRFKQYEVSPLNVLKILCEHAKYLDLDYSIDGNTLIVGSGYSNPIEWKEYEWGGLDDDISQMEERIKKGVVE